MSQPLQYSMIGEIKTPIKKNNTYKNKHMKKKVKNFLESMENNESNLEDFNPKKSEAAPAPQSIPKPIPKPTQYPQSHYIPYYTNISKNGSKDELLEKLNYMIHLLEEQQGEKTSNITEELILYLFLGVFVIFVVDSFARAGKYTR
ncbi:hypothetical protein OAI84_00020 [bacterium]|nr:hypothetical protein [bacterium]